MYEISRHDSCGEKILLIQFCHKTEKKFHVMLINSLMEGFGAEWRWVEVFRVWVEIVGSWVKVGDELNTNLIA